VEQLPSVFLSSTFFDLRQVRADLRDFVEDLLGYRLVASEYASFPVDPTADTLENCRSRVEADADIFILIVGNRYGSVPAGHSHSITNLEYLAARTHGIPIFAFVHRDILTTLPLWEKNPTADFSAVVDTPQLFDFVITVRAKDKVWSFPFDTAQDIVAVLRTQFGYLMRRGLTTLRERSTSASFRAISGTALRIAAERPKGWQQLVLAEETEVELRRLRKLRQDHTSGYATATGERVSELEFAKWMQERMDEARRIIRQLNTTLNDTLNTAGLSADVEPITYGAERLAASYREALEWAQRVRSVHVPEVLQPPSIALSAFLDSIIESVEDFPRRLRQTVEEACKSGVTQATLKVALTVDDAIVTSFNDLLRAATDEIVRRAAANDK
jgi:hypothetical protein